MALDVLCVITAHLTVRENMPFNHEGKLKPCLAKVARKGYCANSTFFALFSFHVVDVSGVHVEVFGYLFDGFSLCQCFTNVPMNQVFSPHNFLIDKGLDLITFKLKYVHFRLTTFTFCAYLSIPFVTSTTPTIGGGIPRIAAIS